MRGKVSLYVMTSLAYPSGLEGERWEPAEEQDGQQGERESKGAKAVSKRGKSSLRGRTRRSKTTSRKNHREV